jgi:outer membrane lipoprotein-sorting protein
MMSSSFRFLSVAGTALVLTLATHAQELGILTKARARIGAEAAIHGVKSIHYVGTLVTTDPADPTKQQRAAIDIIFQKNDQQRISATSDKLVETTALDGYEAWQRKQDAADPSKWQVTLLGREQVKRLRANTFETLAFFRGLETRGGRIEDQGPATIDGVACQKVAFDHGSNIIFTRYFDLATGRLVFTETEAGNTLREQGEIIEAGLRFPKTLITTTKNAAGKLQTVTINVEKVTVNETFPASLFRVPALSTKK